CGRRGGWCRAWVGSFGSVGAGRRSRRFSRTHRRPVRGALEGAWCESGVCAAGRDQRISSSRARRSREAERGHLRGSLMDASEPAVDPCSAPVAACSASYSAIALEYLFHLFCAECFSFRAEANASRVPTRPTTPDTGDGVRRGWSPVLTRAESVTEARVSAIRAHSTMLIATASGPEVSTTSRR